LLSSGCKYLGPPSSKQTTALKMRHGPLSLETMQEANSLGTAAIGYLGSGTQLRGLVWRMTLARHATTQARL